MENQHRKIAGYRELSQEEIDLMNRIKAFGPQLQELCEDLENYLQKQQHTAWVSDLDEETRLHHSEPLKWLDLGKADLQTGLMKLTRSVAQPSFF